MNWKIVRDAAAAPWKLADAKPDEEFDNAKASSLASIFSVRDVSTTCSLPTPLSPRPGSINHPPSRIETFDNFAYELKIGKPMGENYPVLVSVKAELPKERAPAPTKNRKTNPGSIRNFKRKQKQLADKLENEQKLPARPYLIAKSTIEQFLKDRAALMAEKKPSPSPTAVTSSAGPKSATSPAGPKPASMLKAPVAAPRSAGSPATSSPSPAEPPK